MIVFSKVKSFKEQKILVYVYFKFSWDFWEGGQGHLFRIIIDAT
jgi:hypothetical protein